MPFAEAIRIALSSLRANKLRSFLTVLGILIGVSSVVAVVAITEGLDRYMADQVIGLGTKSFSVQKYPDVITSHSQWVEMCKRRDIELADMDIVREYCESCVAVGADVSTTQDVKWGRTLQESVRISGVTDNYHRIGSVRDLAAGRHMIASDVTGGRRVAVIGADIRDAFFGSAEPLGKTISVGGHDVTVVGVVERLGSIFGQSRDNFVWLPITTFQKLFGSRRSVDIRAEAASMDVLDRAQDEARLGMRISRGLQYRDDDDFSIETGQSVMEFWESATRGIYFVTLIVTAISLAVGGVVVMNIMLVAVSERVREIGIRKALGAKRRDILRQFLIEAIVLSAAGGALGVIGAGTFAYVLGGALASWMNTDFTTPIQPWAVGLAVGMSATVGLVAGIYPAGRAAALDPITALRSE